MTIMVVAPGFALHTKRFIKILLSQGHRVVAICEQNPLPEMRDGFSFYRPLFLVPVLSFTVGRIHHYAALILGNKMGYRIRILIDGLLLRCMWIWIRPDLVYVLWVNSMANICIAGGLRPLILHVWGSDINQYFQPGLEPYEPYGRELCGQALSAADLVIYDAPDMKDKCELLAGKTLKTTFLHFGVDTTFFSTRPLSVRNAWRERFHIPEDAFVFLSARAWHPKYRHQDILEAFALSLGKLSRKVYLVFKLYNGDNYKELDQYREKLRSRAEALGISDVVLWVEEMTYEELPDLYAMSDVVVNFPSMDALGITLMEAAACKRRIISIALPCYKGTFVEKSARMVTDINGLKEAIIGVVNEPTSDEILTEARKEVEIYFNDRLFQEKLEEVNKSFLKPHT